MIKPRILDKNVLTMKEQIGIATHQNGEKLIFVEV